MRLLYLVNANYFRTGGGHTTFRAICEQLVREGHEVIYLGTLSDPAGERDAMVRRSLGQLESNGIATEGKGPPFVFEYRGVQVHIVNTDQDLSAYAKSLIGRWQPDWLATVRACPTWLMREIFDFFPADRIVMSNLASYGTPFGPDAVNVDPEKTELMRRARGIFVPSQFVARYLQAHAGLSATVLYLPAFGPTPHARINNPAGTNLLVNPMRVKGLDIFVGLARALPTQSFSAIGGPNTPEVTDALTGLPNVTRLDAVPHARMDEIYAQTRILLVPSIFNDAFPFVVIEAMMRGIPVLTSNTGGTVECKLGVPHVIPVAPLGPYSGKGQPRDFPEQNLNPWREVLEQLQDPAAYEALSAQSYEVANAWVARLPQDTFSRWLATLR